MKEVLAGTIKMLHPFTPFITEEIFGAMKEIGLSTDKSAHIMMSEWPKHDPSAVNKEVEAKVGFVQEVVAAIRNLRAEKNIPPSKKGDVLVLCDSPEKRNWLNTMDTAARTLSKTESLAVLAEGAPPKNAASAVVAGVNVFLNLEGMVDKAAEREKIQKEIERSEGFMLSIQKKLKNEGFVKSAPPEVVEKERVKMETARDKIEKLKENLKLFE